MLMLAAAAAFVGQHLGAVCCAVESPYGFSRDALCVDDVDRGRDVSNDPPAATSTPPRGPVKFLYGV